MGNGTKRTAARADRSEQQECSPPLMETLLSIGTKCLFAYRVDPFFVQNLLREACPTVQRFFKPGGKPHITLRTFFEECELENLLQQGRPQPSSQPWSGGNGWSL